MRTSNFLSEKTWNFFENYDVSGRTREGIQVIWTFANKGKGVIFCNIVRTSFKDGFQVRI